MYAHYGHRIAILGGLDMDFLTRSTPEDVSTRVTHLVRTTRCKGYAIGSGNSLTADMPRENLNALWRAATG